MLWLLAFLPIISGFTVYDCTTPSTQGTYQLLTLDDCLNKFPITNKETVVSGTLLQMPSVTKIQGTLFEITEVMEKSYCTYYRLRTKLIIPTNYEAYTPSLFPVSIINTWLTTGVITLSKVSIPIAYDTQLTVTDTDQVDSEGYCKSYKVKIAFTSYRIKIRRVPIQLLLTAEGAPDRMVAFSERVTGSPESGLGRLATGAYLKWDPKDIPNCPWESVFSGSYKIAAGPDEAEISLFPSLSAGLVLHKKIHMCNHEVYTTSHHQLYVSRGHVITAPALNTDTSVSWSALIRTAVQYQASVQQTSHSNLTRSIQINQCILEQKMHRETLFSAATSPELVGYRLSGQLGSAIVVAGGAIQVLKCKENNARLHLMTKCYSLVPIQLIPSNETKFMDPVTRVIKSTASKIPCDDLQVPYFEMRGIWYRLMPHQTSSPAPPALPSDMKEFVVHNLGEVKGLYPEETLYREETRWAYQEARDKALNGLIHWSDPAIGDPQYTPHGSTSKFTNSLAESDWSEFHQYHWAATTVGWIWLIALSAVLGWVVLRTRGSPKEGDHNTQVFIPISNMARVDNDTEGEGLSRGSLLV